MNTDTCAGIIRLEKRNFAYYPLLPIESIKARHFAKKVCQQPDKSESREFLNK